MNISWRKQAKGLISVLYIGKGTISVIANGFKTKDFKALHIMSASCNFVYPCMICRQALVDLCPKDLDIVLYDADSEDIIHTTIEELAPYAFSKGDL